MSRLICLRHARIPPIEKAATATRINNVRIVKRTRGIRISESSESWISVRTFETVAC